MTAEKDFVLIRVASSTRDSLNFIAEKTGEKQHQVVERLVQQELTLPKSDDRDVADVLREIVLKGDGRTDQELQGAVLKRGLLASVAQISTLRKVWQ